MLYYPGCTTDLRWMRWFISALKKALAYYAIPENSADDGERARKSLANKQEGK
jgi:hypothetical protein